MDSMELHVLHRDAIDFDGCHGLHWIGWNSFETKKFDGCHGIRIRPWWSIQIPWREHHGMHGILWLIHGVRRNSIENRWHSMEPWSSMEFHETRWTTSNSMDSIKFQAIYGIQCNPWNSKGSNEFHEVSWSLMYFIECHGFHELPCKRSNSMQSKGFRGFPWKTIETVIQGIPWLPLFHWIQWNSMALWLSKFSLKTNVFNRIP